MRPQSQPQITSLDTLGLIGNCQISAITDGHGGIAWLCLPQPDGPSVFAQLLDPDAGHFTIAPPGDDQVLSRSSDYLVNTNVVRTVFETESGSFEVIDFCPRFQYADRLFRPPQLFRIMRPLSGTPMVKVSCVPKWNYATSSGTVGFGSHHINYTDGTHLLRLTTTVPLTYLREARPFQLKESHYFVLSYGSPFEEEIVPTVEASLAKTIQYWHLWVRSCALPQRYGEAVIRSALCLKLHVYEDTGAILAATTTSLPESPGQGRTWDYRYCWLRDSFFEIDALQQIGQTAEVEGFIDYLSNIAAGSRDGALQPVYRISGSSSLDEFMLDHLRGYRNEGPVRVGNAASVYAQHDVYGELILAIAPVLLDPRFADRRDRSTGALFDQIAWLAQRCIQFGGQTDAGIWEFRSEPRHHLLTRMMSVAGLREATRIAKALGKNGETEHWHAAASTLWDETCKACATSPVGFPQTLKAPWLVDASSLILPALGLIDAKDPLYLRTVQSVEERLLTPCGLKRYEGVDDFGVVLSCFGLCTFWYIDALVELGRLEEAHAWFERILGFRNKLGLLSEDWSTETGELWGNFPQVYSHVGLIRTAMRLSKAMPA